MPQRALRSRRFLLLLPLLSMAATTPVHAQWTPEGVILNSLGRAFGEPVITSDGTGGAIVAWLGDEGGRGDGYDIYAQRITAEGWIAAGWPIEAVPVCVEPSFQGGTRIAPDGAGGVYVGWMDYRNYFVSGSDCYVQRITANGSIAPGWPVNGIPLAIVPGDQINPEIAPDGAGGVYVVWDDHRRDPGYPYGTWLQNDFYAQHLTAEGQVAPGWPVDGLPICLAPTPSIRYYLSVMPDGAGGLYVAWRDARPGGGIYAVRVTPQGTAAPGWVEGGRPVNSVPFNQSQPALAPDGEGGFIVAGIDYRRLASSDVFAQRMTGSGEVARGWPTDGALLCTAYEEQSVIGVIPDGWGGAIAFWTDYRNYFPNGADIYGQRIRADGTIAPGWPVDGAPFAASRTAFETTEWRPAAVPDGAGGVLMAFDLVGSGGDDTYIQHITSSGVPAPGWPVDGAPLKPERDGEGSPAAVSDGIGGMLVAWHSQYPGGYGGVHTRVQRVTGDCPTVPSLPVELSVDPPVLNPRAQGRWITVRLEPAPPHAVATIDLASLRLNGTAMVDPSAPVQTTDRDRDGIEELAVRFPRAGLDLTALPGQDSLLLRVTGKLGDQCLFGVARVRMVGAASAVAEARPVPALEAPPTDELTVSPMPARDRFTLRFYQREEGAATLRLHDLAGRRVASRALEVRGPGWHLERVELPRLLSAGMYFLSLDDARGTRTHRVIVAR